MTKKPDVPDITGLLSDLSTSRDSGDLRKADIQKVVSVSTEKQKNVKTNKPKNDIAEKTVPVETTRTGRPSAKNKDAFTYVRLGAHIPKPIKTVMGDALTHEWFTLKGGYVIKTHDELVTFALARLFEEKKKQSGALSESHEKLLPPDKFFNS